VANLVRDELDKLRDVLTKKQQEKLQDLKEERQERVRDRMAHRVANLRDLNLADEQKAKIADLRKEYRPKVQEARQQTASHRQGRGGQDPGRYQRMTQARARRTRTANQGTPLKRV
jgi:Spy/CpxP family protein refolding chaperone